MNQSWQYTCTKAENKKMNETVRLWRNKQPWSLNKMVRSVLFQLNETVSFVQVFFFDQNDVFWSCWMLHSYFDHFCVSKVFRRFWGYFDGFMRILVNFGGVGLVYSEFFKNWFTKVKMIKQFTIERVILLSK